MTDQPDPRPDAQPAQPDAQGYPPAQPAQPDAQGYPPTPPAQPDAQGYPPSPLEPVAQPLGWSAAPAADAPGGEAYPPPPPPAVALPAAEPPAPAKQPGKWRVAIPLVIIGGFLAFVLWSVRDNQSADDLANGTCFDVPTETTVSTVTKRACTEAHDAEVFHNVEYTSDSTTYPISLTMDRFVTDTCGPVFETYVGETFEDSDLTIGYFYPSFDGWDDGDRTVTCYARPMDGSKLSQSVKAGS